MPAESGQDDTVVTFVGADQRERLFDVSALPLPDWHPLLAAGLRALIGPGGSRRTVASAKGTWSTMARFIRALAELPDPPHHPRALTPAQVENYFTDQRRSISAQSIGAELLRLRGLFRTPALHAELEPTVLDQLNRRTTIPRTAGSSGYSDGELTRILRAARHDVAQLRDRIDAGEHRLAALDDEHAALRQLADTGTPVWTSKGGASAEMRRRRDLAGQLFVTRADLEPLLLLLVAVTQRNIETIKELPAEHRILEGRAVEVHLTKRRRGRQRWHDTVTWEIGPQHRELHTPGGLYLLAHRLMARGRALSGSTSIWSIWRNTLRNRAADGEHADPFARTLEASLKLPAWSARHGLRTDDGTEPLQVASGRLRTSMEVRRTRAAGGHLPSAARSNSVAVLFADYLRGDATAIDWAHDVTAEAFVDAEHAALQAHQRALSATGGTTLTVHPAGSPADPDPATEAAWNACTDPQSHPSTGTACRRVSALDCFHCANCVITPAHLPAILALRGALDQRRAIESTDRWWTRYGPAWAAIQHHVLPKFTPAEVEHAHAGAVPATWLDLVEDPWEHP
ncbi:hypothetical protein ACIA5G_39540 [Amycolatopsis sp. NPDC051758]|uniref:hypothetical protein n=1 Tax=Amycolatopsis sp. NPDC051758 TaxID=3363935 RepID=UPI0037A504B0